MATKVKPSRINISGTIQQGQVPTYVNDDCFGVGTIPTDNCELANGCGYTTCTGTVTATDLQCYVQCCDMSGYQLTCNMVCTLSGADDSHYPTAKTVADALSCAGAGDMLKSVYDPCGCNADAFDYCNFYNTPTIPTDNCQLANGCGYTTCTGTLVAADIACLAQCCDIPTDNCQLANGCGYTTCTGTVSTCLDVITALGYTPYNVSNPCNYINSFAGVISALGYTPYNNTNPCGFTTCTGTLSTCSDITTALGYTPYSNANPCGYTTCTGTLVPSDIACINGCCLTNGGDICIQGGNNKIGNSYAIEDIANGDILYTDISTDLASSLTNYSAVGFELGQKIATRRVLNGQTFSSISLSLAKVGTPGGNLTIRIETDSGGNPSGTLIDGNATGTVSQGSLTNTLTETTVLLQGSVNYSGPCRIVLTTSNYSNSNYYICGGELGYSPILLLKLFDGSTWKKYDNIVNMGFQTPAASASYTTATGKGNQGHGIAIDPTGTKLFFSTANGMYMKTLTTPWNITTGTTAAISGISNNYYFSFSYDGKHLYSGGNQYDLTAAWDLSTATNTGKTYSYRGISLSQDGTKGCGISSNGFNIVAFTLSTPFDVSTLTEISSAQPVFRELYNCTITQDGTKMYAGGQDGVFIYNLTTPWSTSGATDGGNISGYPGRANVAYDPNGLYFLAINNMNYNTQATMYIYTSGTQLTFGDITKMFVGGSQFETDYIGKANAVDGIPVAAFSADDDYSGGDLVKYRTDVSSQSNLIIGQTYYLSDTPGEISSSAGTNEYEVGISIEKTILKLKQTY